MSQYINTGDLVVVEGKLKNNNYTDRNGKKHSEMYVQSNNISLLRKKGISSEAPQRVSKNGRSYIQQTNLNNRSNNYGYDTGYVQNSEPPF